MTAHVPEPRRYHPPSQDDIDRAMELVDAIGPVEHRALAIEMAANVICNARLAGKVEGLQHAVRAQQ